MTEKTADIIIIGGGIAGASAGYELCKEAKVIILEKEAVPAYHTTGRSSAIFQLGYNKGDPLLNILVRASANFLYHPPAGFTDHPLLTPRPMIHIATKDNQAILDDLEARLDAIDVPSAFIDGGDLLPILSEDYRGRALQEYGAADIDVNALHQGYLRAIRAAGGEVITKAEVLGLQRHEGWQVRSSKGLFTAPIVINAAGAWVDQIAAMADVTPINIQPLRRTVILSPLSDGENCDDWPVIMGAAEGYYFKPDSGKILMTPGDATCVAPSDVQPEEIDIAYGAHYLSQATNLRVDRIDRSWAGLRNHVTDGHPVAGFDPDVPGFFWLAGQGGFGIKTAPAMGRLTAALIKGCGLPQDMRDLGLTADQVSVERLHNHIIENKAHA
ncbi:MAG: FAD-binding oxidoreductase [Alphaproteobacteria bacterium]|nr:FAD-binding oxidoreductase [Alphaproteobacteria bacterium]